MVVSTSSGDLRGVIFSQLCQKEKSQAKRPTSTLPDAVRSGQVDLVLDVCERLGVSNASSFLAISLLDRLAVCGFFDDPSFHPSVVALAAILLSTKLEEASETPPSPAALFAAVRQCAGRFPVFRNAPSLSRAVAAAEVAIASALRFDVADVTPMAFLDGHLAAATASLPSATRAAVTGHALDVLITSLYSATLCAIPPSIRAAAAVVAGRKSASLPPWSAELAAVWPPLDVDAVLAAEHALSASSPRALVGPFASHEATPPETPPPSSAGAFSEPPSPTGEMMGMGMSMGMGRGEDGMCVGTLCVA